MLIAVFGESCTGKTTLSNALRERIGGEVYTGKDFLRLAKNEADAKRIFSEKLRQAVSGENVIYVITEQEHLALLLEGAVRVLAAADLETIKERFSARMHGKLPAPVAAMLERRHGCFDGEPHDFRVTSGETDLEEACARILSMAK